MTMKEMFKKVEAYNEMAEFMRTDKAVICYCDNCFTAARLESFDSFRKYIRREYVKEIADAVLKFSDWEFNKEITLEWTDCMGYTQDIRVTAELVAA